MNPWEVVYNELCKNDLFTGWYDAENGSDEFMSGIFTVMEQVAERAGRGDEYRDIFGMHEVASEDKYMARMDL